MVYTMEIIRKSYDYSTIWWQSSLIYPYFKIIKIGKINEI